MTLESIKQYESLEESINDRCRAIATVYIKNDKSHDIKANWSLDGFEINDNDIWIGIYEYWAYGGSDRHSIKVDKNTFVLDDWEKILTDKIEKDNIEFDRKVEDKKEKERLKKIEEAKKILAELDKK